MAERKRILHSDCGPCLRTYIVFLLGLFLPGLVLADTLAVIYPEAPPPYKQVFDQIVDGIEARHPHHLLRYPLEKDYSRNHLLSQLEDDQVDMVVTLGRRGYSLIGDLSGKYPLVSGALPLTPANTVSGVSLIADTRYPIQSAEKPLANHPDVSLCSTPTNPAGWSSWRRNRLRKKGLS